MWSWYICVPVTKQYNLVPVKLVIFSLLKVINTKTLQFNKYCKGLPVKASKQQKSFWG